MAKHGEPTVQDNTNNYSFICCPFPNLEAGFLFFRINFNLIINKV